MKKLLATSIAALVLPLVFTAGAEAQCNVSCLSHRVNALDTALIKAQRKITAQGKAINELSQQVSSQNQVISGQQSAIKTAASAIACMVEAPLTDYGEPEGPFGYIFQFENQAEELETIPTTALDVTYVGDPVGGWALFDHCNTSKVASNASTKAIAPTDGPWPPQAGARLP